MPQIRNSADSLTHSSCFCASPWMVSPRRMLGPWSLRRPSWTRLSRRHTILLTWMACQSWLLTASKLVKCSLDRFGILVKEDECRKWMCRWRLRLQKLGPESFMSSTCSLRRLPRWATTWCQTQLTRSILRWFRLSLLCTPYHGFKHMLTCWHVDMLTWWHDDMMTWWHDRRLLCFKFETLPTHLVTHKASASKKRIGICQVLQISPVLSGSFVNRGIFLKEFP